MAKKTTHRPASSRPVGRPSSYTQDVGDAICERIADGESLRAICAGEDMPNRATVFRWLAAFRDFSDQYARARESQADTLFDEILSIADTPVIGEKRKVKDDGGVEISTGDMIEHRRLQVDARKWMAGKLRPKKYGEKLELEHGGQVALTPTIIFNANKG
jgi:hypothetical protein